MKIGIFLMVVFLSTQLLGQDVKGPSVLLSLHDENVGVKSLGIINGPVYEFKRNSRTTHKFFESKHWTVGEVIINKQTYYDLNLIYDLHSDQLIAKHPDHDFQFGIEIRDVEGFNIHDQQFYWMSHHDLPESGFYEEALRGNNYNLYIRRRKNDLARNQTVEYELKTYLLLEVNDRFFKVNSYKQLVELFPKQKELMKSILKENKLSKKQAEDLEKLIRIFDNKKES